MNICAKAIKMLAYFIIHPVRLLDVLRILISALVLGSMVLSFEVPGFCFEG